MMTPLPENGHYTKFGLSLNVESKGVLPKKLQQCHEGSASIDAVVI